MRQNRGWHRQTGFFGYWEKLWCRTRTYASQMTFMGFTVCSGSRVLADYIVAEVDGPQHYAAQYRYNASIAYAYDWDYIWWGDPHCGTAVSFARRGGGTVGITRRIC